MKSSSVLILLLSSMFFGCINTNKEISDYPDPEKNPQSSLMLQGDWFEDPHEIDFDQLPRVKSEHAVVSDVQPTDGVNQHNYLVHFNDQFWIMWSDGPGVEDRVGQVVKYATSLDGLTWTEPKMLTPYPPGSDPESTHYNTRTDQGFRWIARGFWIYENELLALTSLDEADGFFGPGLELRAFRWGEEDQQWVEKGIIHDNAINNFPPKQLPDR